MNELLGQLRQRKVIRVGLIYCAAMFAVLEFADIAFPRLGFSDAAVDAVLIVGLLAGAGGSFLTVELTKQERKAPTVAGQLPHLIPIQMAALQRPTVKPAPARKSAAGLAPARKPARPSAKG